MIPRYRAWIKSLKWMCDVTNISFDSKFVDICQQGDTERCTEMSVEFDEIKLMQSTGLKDKNGKEIFEGDIVDYKGRKALVSWHGSYASFIYRFVDELQKRNAEWNPLYLAYMRCEIIGNIYENPELWEVNG
ncbi:YopX family protein [Streptococcus infantis]|uniref:YopX family protein n=1 Tax=Streptococcus infantis TaxID=68892 RepID=UPI00204E1D03|nr:MAG TPA: YopX protein [Caudoviricetes sp.]